MSIGNRLSPLVCHTRAPAIAEMAALVRKERQKSRQLIDLGQAVPNYPPPAGALGALVPKLDEVKTHQYSPDEGLLTLRSRWAELLGQRFGLWADPATQMLLTAGANQAYLMAAMTVLGPGDKMGLLSPWYFNHAMAVEMLGAQLVELPLDPSRGYQLDVDHILEQARRHKLKALTLICPNNPTGAVYPRQDLKRLTEGLLDLGVFLLVDETYAFFADPTAGHFSPGSLEKSPEQVITIGSFSKTFAMTGWRIGYIVASEPLIAQMLKVQDTMVICPSHPGQLLVQACLDCAWDWLEQRRQEIARRSQAVREAAPSLAPWTVHSVGPFFAYLSGPRLAKEVALDLLYKDGVIVIPGTSFGSGLDNTIRLSLGGVEEKDLKEGLVRLGARFAAY